MTKIEDIVKKEFSRSFMGYDMREVDFFLDEIIEQMETYERERQEMLTAMEYLLRELEQFDDIADDAEKQLHDAADEQDAAASGRARKRAMHVKPVVPPADPAQEAPENAAAEAIVLEEYELHGAAPLSDENAAQTSETEHGVSDMPDAPAADAGAAQQETADNAAPAASAEPALPVQPEGSAPGETATAGETPVAPDAVLNEDASTPDADAPQADETAEENPLEETETH